ncbi:LysM peptidoglycan-binding domain-containing protein [Brevibacillus thermoruber]|uniref:LysM peptidoglycan-binding domain-containing protein n=1 Tax=Brevibacillus thermoruber TaxID=33942 RepID=UPI0004181D97|nr:LysM peptidoglycan-binding domain-containing protein [Brevibacillus thermoruber]
MAIQDGLLSFAIKETIFLSADRAGIGELKELELVPDIEVLENQSFISITGCLQLYGTYEPARGASEPTEGGAETLVEAVTFAPFPQAGNSGGLFGWEAEVNHRIPLNITIPVSRIAELGDIYAVVDGFDYQVETPHQLLIEAELKIAGIQLVEQAQRSALQPDSAAESANDAALETDPDWASAPQVEPAMRPERDTAEADLSVRADVQMETDSDMHPDVVPESRAAEEWRSDSISSDQWDRVAHPASLEELEQRLSELEREMEREPHAEAGEPPEFAAMFDRPASPLPSSRTDFGDVTDHTVYGDVTAPSVYGDVTDAWDQPALEADEYRSTSFEQIPPWDEMTRASAREESSRRESAPDSAASGFASSKEAEVKETGGVEARAEVKETGIAKAEVDESGIVEAGAKAEEMGVVEAGAKAEETGVVEAKAEAEETDIVEAQAEPDVLEAQAAPQEEEEREVRVAISGKPTKEEGEKLNLTSIFSQASRAQQEAQAAESAELSSSFSRRAAAFEPDSTTLEAMHNLTSFIRSKQERYSQMKLCIIQRNDTLESISQRYSLPISRILEVNKLNADQVVEGQILYIPV